ncbi:hypothetical protein NKH18_22865 [Streptomyces sp. M10(2022)]
MFRYGRGRKQGFEQTGYWGPRNNPDADRNIAALIDAWQDSGRPPVFVRHDSSEPDSPLRVGQPGNEFKQYVRERRGKGAGRGVVAERAGAARATAVTLHGGGFAMVVNSAELVAAVK